MNSSLLLLGCGFLALACGYWGGLRSIQLEQAPSSASPVPKGETLAPNVVGPHTRKADATALTQILADPNEAVKWARLREWIRHANVESLLQDLHPALITLGKFPVEIVSVLAQRDVGLTMRWLHEIEFTPTTSAHWQAVWEGLALAHPTEVVARFQRHDANDVAWTGIDPEDHPERGLIRGLATADAAEAWKFLQSFPTANDQELAGAIYKAWMEQSPATAWQHWAQWRTVDLESKRLAWEARPDRKPDETFSERSTADEILPQLVEGLQRLPKEAAAGLIREHEDLLKEGATLSGLIENDPIWWRDQGLAEDAPALLKSQIHDWAKGSPLWALEHVETLPPVSQGIIITASLSGELLKQAVQMKGVQGGGGGDFFMGYLNRLSAANRAQVVGNVIGAELLNDPTMALTLLSEVPEQERMKALEPAALMTSVEPRLLEQQMLAATGTDEAKRDLRFVLALGTQVLFGSPHEAICNAASLQDPELRHDAFAINLVGDKDPEIQAMTFAWLKDMPAGIVDRAELQAALDRVKPQFERLEKQDPGEKSSEEQFNSIAELLKSFP